MMYGVLFVGVPVFVYLLAVILPEGRGALAGIVLATLALGALWVAKAVNFAPIFTGEAASDGLTTALLAVASGALALGAVVQFIRTRLPMNRRGWIYPALAILTAVLAVLPVIRSLGL